MTSRLKFTGHFNALPSLIVIITMLTFFVSCQSEFIIDNPYENVKWEEYGRYKADLHVHTSRSDGHLSPSVLVDRYRDAGFKILAITDHDLVTYPWQEFSSFKASDYITKNWETAITYLPYEKIFNYQDRNPDSLGMIAVQGNEISTHHHIGSYFSDCKSQKNETETIKEIARKNGLAVMNHPGRIEGNENKPVDWYVDLFQKHDNLIGMEAYNTGLYHQPGSIQKWDSTLMQLMPGRPVWGFSNEDYHGDYRINGEVRHIIGRNGNEFLLPELSLEEVRSAMENGVFFFFHAPKGPEGPSPPVIHSVRSDSKKGTISIDASGYEYIEWISDGAVVHTGDQIILSDVPDIGSYVRAVIYGSREGAFICTQPFGIRHRQ